MLYQWAWYDQKPRHTWQNVLFQRAHSRIMLFTVEPSFAVNISCLAPAKVLNCFFESESVRPCPIQPTEHLWGQVLIRRPGWQSLFDFLPEIFIGVEVIISSRPVGLLHAKACLYRCYFVHSGTATWNNKEPPSNGFALNIFVSSSIKKTLHWNQWTSPKAPDRNPSFCTFCRKHCAFQ